jgi:hypothetical protein
MTANRKTANIVGVLFILAAVTAIAGALLYNPILNDPAYITKSTFVMRLLFERLNNDAAGGLLYRAGSFI